MARIPLTAIPATRSSKPILKAKLMLVLSFLVVATMAGIFATFAWVSTASTPPPAADPTVRRDGQALAEIAARDFLAGRKSAVPVAEGVAADFTPQAAPGSAPPKPLGFQEVVLHHSRRVSVGNKVPRTVELNSFYATSGGTLFEVTVPMVLPSDYDNSGHKTSPVLAGSPAILPVVPVVEEGQEGAHYDDYPNALTPDAVNPAVAKRVAVWGRTFANACTDEDQALLQLTGDGDGSGYRYSGLCGYTVTDKDVQILGAVPVGDPRPGLIVRVAVALRAPGTNGPTLNTQYDLYVGFTGSEALPPIYAWGPAGSFSELDLHQNASQQ